MECAYNRPSLSNYLHKAGCPPLLAPKLLRCQGVTFFSHETFHFILYTSTYALCLRKGYRRVGVVAFFGGGVTGCDVTGCDAHLHAGIIAPSSV